MLLDREANGEPSVWKMAKNTWNDISDRCNGEEDKEREIK
jgi:hypothetical protein